MSHALTSILAVRVLVVGGDLLIGCHVNSQLLRTDIEEVVVFDNFSRGNFLNVRESLESPSLLKLSRYKKTQKLLEEHKFGSNNRCLLV